MTLPTFSAEASIYRSTATYIAGSTGVSTDAVAMGPAAVILPQLIATGEYWNCVAEHYEAGFPMNMSNFFCAGEGGGEGPTGPQEPTCRPGCGPCINGVRTCITYDCSDYERPCSTRRPTRR